MREVEERSGISGIITFQNFRIETPRAEEIDRYLAEAVNVPHETYRKLIRELGNLCQRRVLMVHNQVILAARSEIAKRLCGTQAYTGTINYGALGTGSTAVADANTQLATEAVRALVATATQTNDTATVDFYYSKASWNGTAQEFGTFIDGTASANSGLLFNRALTGGWTKSSTESLTVSVQFNINAA